jgi:hypothetical protein
MTQQIERQVWDKAYADGWLAFQAELRFQTNPYPFEVFQHLCWNLGWKAARSGSVRRPRLLVQQEKHA